MFTDHAGWCHTSSSRFISILMNPPEAVRSIFGAAGSVTLQDGYKSKWDTPSLKGCENSNHRQHRDKKLGHSGHLSISTWRNFFVKYHGSWLSRACCMQRDVPKD